MRNLVRTFKHSQVFFGLLVLLTTSLGYASSGITYHGRILRPDGLTPVTSTTTQFRIQVRTPGGENCLLWEEQQTKDLSQTAGVFTLTINDTSEPTLLANTLPYALERVFSNRTNFTSLTGCSTGNSYNPTLADGRNLQVYFREQPTDQWEQMPLTKVNYVPLALNSVQLEGYQAAEFLKVDPLSSYTTLSAANVNTLVDIIAGTSNLYVKSAQAFGGDVSGTYGAISVDKVKGVAVAATAPTTGQVLKYNGTTWAPAADDNNASPADASYTVKGIVQINTDLATSGLFIAGGVLALPNVITAGGPIGTAQSVPVITYDTKGRLTAVSTATIDDTTKLPLAGGTMTGNINMGTKDITNATNIAATNASVRNLILNDNDTNTITLKAPSDVAPINYALTLPATAGTNGYVLATDGSGNLSWINPSGGSVTSVSSANNYLTVTSPTTTPVLTVNVGTVANTVAAGDDARIVGALQTSTYDADVLPAASCTNVQTAYWNGVAGTWACQNIGTVPTATSAVNFTGSLAGDVSGTQGATSVDKLKGKNISAATAANQIMLYDGTNWVNNIVSGDATLASTGALTLKNTGTAGTYYKVTTDAQGRVTAGSNLVIGDITTALGYTPVNKAGDTMSGTLGLYATAADPSTAGWDATQKGYTWFNTTSNQVKYWDGAAIQALGISGAGLTSLGGQSGSTQTFAAGAAGTAPAIASAGNVHTLNVPLASGAGVTSGTISKTDYDSFVAKLTSPLTTKGDLLAFSTVNARLPAGTDGQFLTADSAQATGLKWNTLSINSLLPSQATNSGKYLTTDGTNTSWAAVTSGTVTSVSSTNAYATVATPTTTPAITINVGTAANTLAAGDDARIVGAVQQAAYAADLAPAALCTNVQTPYWNTVSDLWACQNINAAAMGAFVDGGNTMTATATVGTNSNHDLEIETNATTKMTVKAGGNVGIGTTSPATKLDVAGGLKIGTEASACAAGLAGAMRYNGGAVEYCNGSAWQAFGVSGAGLTSLNAQTGSTQTFANGSTGTAPAFSSATNVHTLNIPLASGAGVTSGTISKTDYDSFVAKLTSPLTTKGDLLTFSTVNARLPAGTDGQVLQADSTQATGLKWATPTAGTVTSVSSTNAYMSVATGTTTPALTVNVGTVANTVAAGDDARIVGAFVNGGNTMTATATIGTNSNHNLEIETNGTTKMTVQADGKIGIGGSPSSTLDVLGTFSSGGVTTGTNNVSGLNGAALGSGLSVTGNNSFAAGYNGVASGNNSFVGNYLGNAAGNNSTAFGEWNLPGSRGEFAVGTYGLNLGGNATTIVSTDPVFTVGNGTAAGSRSNALTILKNGNAGFNVSSPTSAIDLSGSVTYRGIAAPALSAAGTARLYFDSTSNTYKLSQNGGAYADILTSATASGDITDVVAGAGLTGGAASGSATVNVIAGTGIVVNADDVAVDVGTAAGKIVQVQAGGKLPALDGSDLTNLDAGDIATGTLPIARGGTGQVTAVAALNALLPAQATNSGKVLQTDGTNATWVAPPATGVTSVTSANSYLSIATTTTTPVITANVGTAANTLAAGDDARIVGALQTSVYDADVLPAASCTNVQTAYWNGVAGTWACQNINFASTGGFVDGGNTMTATATLGTNSNHNLEIETNGTTKMTIATDGKVGIGTTAPNWPLHVVNSSTGTPTTIAMDNPDTTNANGLNFSFRTTSTGGGGSTLKEFAAIQTSFSEHDNATAAASMKFWTRSAGTLAERMRIDTSGNVGIGTTTPTAGTRLDITGTGAAASSIIIPRDTVANRPTTGVNGMLRYASDTNKFEVYENGAWVNMVSSASGTVSGTTGKIAKFTSGTAVGDSLLSESGSIVTLNGVLNLPATTSTVGQLSIAGTPILHTYGSSSVFLGDSSGNFTMTGGLGFNTGVGSSTLNANTSGSMNTAIGAGALYGNTTGNYNTALGYMAGYTTTAANKVTTGGSNTFIGYDTGFASSTQRSNSTAIGYGARVNADNALVLGNSSVKVGIGAVTAPTAVLDFTGDLNIGQVAAPSLSAINNGKIYFDSTSKTFKVSQNNGPFVDLIPAGGAIGGSGTTNALPRFTGASTLGDSAIVDNGTTIMATRSIATVTNPVATGAALNLATSNTHTLTSVGGSVITISNQSNGGVYNIAVEDTTSRTYTFSGCTNSYFKPANGPTQAGTRTVYGLMTIQKGANWDCYVTWSSGFQ